MKLASRQDKSSLDSSVDECTSIILAPSGRPPASGPSQPTWAASPPVDSQYPQPLSLLLST